MKRLLVAMFIAATCLSGCDVPAPAAKSKTVEARRRKEAPLADMTLRVWVEDLKSEKRQTRLQACEELANMGRNARGAVETLEAVAEKDESTAVRKAAKHALTKIL